MKNVILPPYHFLPPLATPSLSPHKQTCRSCLCLAASWSREKKTKDSVTLSPTQLPPEAALASGQTAKAGWQFPGPSLVNTQLQQKPQFREQLEKGAQVSLEPLVPTDQNMRRPPMTQPSSSALTWSQQTCLTTSCPPDTCSWLENKRDRKHVLPRL